VDKKGNIQEMEKRYQKNAPEKGTNPRGARLFAMLKWAEIGSPKGVRRKLSKTKSTGG